MKISKYNFYFDLDNNNEEKLIYNSRTNALATIENKNLNVLLQQREDNITIEDAELFNNLKHGGFIVENEINELDLIKFKMLETKFNTSALGLTIATTEDCNFRCIYCFEKDNMKKVHLSKDVQDKLVEYVESQIKTINKFNVTWYGGEPLLSMDVIEYLSNKFIALCKEHNVSYYATIVTNGYLMNTKNAKKLKDLKVRSAQITLDGTADIHDSRRPLVNGNPTFNTILKNISSSIDILPINIRVNLDKTNVNCLDRLLDVLEKYNLKGKVNISLGHVLDFNDCYDNNTCFTKKDFSDIEFKAQKLIRDRNFTNKNIKYPKAKSCYCGAERLNTFVVGVNGNMYKCWNDIGVEELSVGNLLTSENKNIPVNNTYLLYDSTTDSECSVCPYLPICAGGCPSIRINNKEGRCINYKYKLDDYIKYYVEHQLKNSNVLS